MEKITQPLFSIIIPTYNSATFIGGVFDTLVNQSLRDFEVIFSDDGSTDNTVSMINDFIEMNVGLKISLVTGKHDGPGAARNRGLDTACGRYVCFLDSDDQWTLNKLECTKNEILRNPDANTFVHWEMLNSREGTTRIMKHGFTDITRGDSLIKGLYLKCLLSTSATTIDRYFLESKPYRFDESLPSGQDYDLWMTMSPHMVLCTTPMVLGFYNERVGNITSSPYLIRALRLLKILFRHRSSVGNLLLLRRLFSLLVSFEWIRDMFRWRSL